MARLNAATVSNQIVHRKRKRKNTQELPATNSDQADHNQSNADWSDENAVTAAEDDGAVAETETENATATTTSTSCTTTVPTKTGDGGKKPRRRTKKGDATAPKLRRQSSSTMVESKIPWPEHFRRLASTHRALNLVFTFVCTRKHLATTFETMRSAVEQHIKRELLVQEVAEIKALIPRALTFTYVDEEALQVAVMGEEDGVKGFRAKEFRPLDLDKDPYTAAGTVSASSGNHEVLFFEFIDEDLKRQVVDPKTGQPTNAFQKLRREDLKMPVFSQKQMTKLIEKRNTKFTSAVNELLNQCHEEGVDAVELIKNSAQHYLPQPASAPGTPAPELSGGKSPLTIPKERDDIPEIIKQIKEQDWYVGQIVPDGHRVFDPQTPIYGDLNFALSQNLVNSLYNVKGITKFYAHQAEAINNLYDGYNVIVSTSTSSGKSLIYQVPMLHELERESNSRGMYIFPTKALAQDQRRSMVELLQYIPGFEQTLVETFDGDTPMDARNFIRDEAKVIFTNPDMLHITILPQEEKWRTFLQNLKFVVVDELHVYNGLFGSHVSFIMRRLRRICAAIGNRHVRFVSCSATVSNPEEHMKTIFGVDKVRLTDFDGSPSGRKEFVCWNTPYKDPGDPSSGRGDAMAEAARLFCELIMRGVRVIAFCKIRKGCEVMITAVRNYAQSIERPELADRMMGYRGGYQAHDRRKIETEMFSGRLMGIVATTALELGIDIGSLDAVITVGFPYTIANLRQQSGRAGRRNKDSLSVLLGDCFATDQYFMENPDEIFTKPNCELQVDLTNALVLEGHLQCAAFEIPIRPEEDQAYFGKQLPEIAEQRLIKDDIGFYHCHERFRPQPSRCVAIRDTEDGHFAVVDITNGRNIVLEEVEPSRAFFTIYDGGIFLHQGHTYLVKEFNPDEKFAKVIKVHVDWTTQQRDFTDVDPLVTEAIRRLPAPSMSKVFFGDIRIRMTVFGFFKVDKRRRILDAVEVDNPPVEIFAKGMWLDVPKEALEVLKMRRLNLAAAIHAAEHALLSLMPQFVLSMPGDVRTECKNALKEFAKKETQRKRPARLTFYDSKGGAGGAGIAAKAFEFADMLLERAVERVTACHCIDGCLECVCDERCKEKNQVTSKAGAEVVLKCLLGKRNEIDIDALPWGEDDRVPAGVETVVMAEPVRRRDGVTETEAMVRGKLSRTKARGTQSDAIVIKEEPIEW